MDQIASMIDKTLVLRTGVAVILIMHSVPGMFDGGVNAFGNLYLNEIGFAPFGVFLAWTIKLSHAVAAILLLANRYLSVAAFITLPTLIMGIIMIHFKEGWFVVGGGRNGMEFNILLMCALIYLALINTKK